MPPHLPDDLRSFLGEDVVLPLCSTMTVSIPARDAGQLPQVRRWRRPQTALVGQLRHGPAQRGVHPPGVGQEVAEFGRKRRVPGGDPAQRRLVDGFGVPALADLGQLLRVAEQEQPAAGLGHRQRVGQGELPGLVDHQEIQRPGEDCGAGHGPRGAADQRPAADAENSRTSLAVRRSHGRGPSCLPLSRHARGPLRPWSRRWSTGSPRRRGTARRRRPSSPAPPGAR